MSQKDLNLRQRRWLELLKDYDMIIDYHPRKTNLVTDALSRKSMFSLRISEAQKNDNELRAKRVHYELSSDSKFQIGSNDCLLFRGRICVPKNSKLVQKILNKAHNGTMSVHPEVNKMYNDLKKMY
ncbi:DNA/RNA polymerases superfamily protein [Gossypium australe]|uniref:DNA/RNA polymerases superfamily protein n=1 Tax=Gossypium australe TaxID=47621 RepID=A0A5B6WSA4_9ROSI|nr:DNA/RNA polymerases superfamily protein [Gossypium australe]